MTTHTTHRMDVESWDDLALAAAETLHKGMQVHVMGRLKVDQYPHRDHPGVTMTKPKVRGVAACWQHWAAAGTVSTPGCSMA